MPLYLMAQVGIETTTPIAMLDVNGDLRIATTTEGTLTAAKDSILVVDGDGIVKRISSDQIFYSAVKTAAKGGINDDIALLSLLVFTWNQMAFDNIEFDMAGEYDTEKDEFVIANDGIYRIYFQYKYSATIALSLTPGIIIKMNGDEIATTHPLLTLDEYLVAETMVELEAGDVITFHYGALVELGILTIDSDITNTFFTVERIN